MQLNEVPRDLHHLLPSAAEHHSPNTLTLWEKIHHHTVRQYLGEIAVYVLLCSQTAFKSLKSVLSVETLPFTQKQGVARICLPV